jgi:ABC-type uncharacterized transport system involved in gliding motility auxiliary subunit
MTSKRKRAMGGANWSFFVLLLVALFVIINYLSFRHFKTYDATFSDEFSLSQQTKKFLKELKNDVEVYVLLPIGDVSYEKVSRLLDSFKVESNNIKVEYVDPERDKGRYEILLKKYEVTNPNSVVFVSGDRSKWVERDEFLEYEYSMFGEPPKIKGFKGEKAFLNAMYDVVDPRNPVIYFTLGHGEKFDFDESGKGASFFKERLSKEGAVIKTLQTAGLKKVPDDASLVIVAGLNIPFTKEEEEVLERYYEEGGSLFLLIDPMFKEGNEIEFKESGLQDLCKKYGVELQNDLVVDPEASLLEGRAQTFYGVDYSSHKITYDLMKNKYPILFTLARSLNIVEPQSSDFKCEKLISTSGKAWGETNLKELKNVKKDKEDFQGPLCLASVVENKKNEKSRMVVIGDSDIISDGTILSGLGGNTIFALNAVHYLVRMEERISIPPKEIKSSSVVLTSTQIITNFIVVVIIYPLIFAILGVVVYFRRRR